MPGINGIDLAGQIIELKPHISIVLVTAYDQYAVSAFELNALDYIVKPIQLDRLKATVNRVKESLQNNAGKHIKTDTLYIQVSGQLKLGRTKKDLQVQPWRTAKAQELFLYLLQNQHRLVRKSMLAELLWPEFEEDKAYAQLYTTVYHIRRVLHAFGNRLQVKSKMDGYILDLKSVWIDLHEWEVALKQLPSVSPKTVATYEHVMGLYTGAYLEAYDYLWAAAERYRLEQLWLNIAFEIAQYYEQERLTNEAIGWYQSICDVQPESETAHLSLMKIYQQLNQKSLVQQQYNNLKNVLDEDIGIEPSPHIINWYNNWEKQLSSPRR